MRSRIIESKGLYILMTSGVHIELSEPCVAFVFIIRIIRVIA